MTRPSLIMIEAFAAGFFALSTLLTAAYLAIFADGADPEVSGTVRSSALLADLLPQTVNLNVVSRPDNPIMWALLVMAIIAALIHLGARLANRMAPPAPWALVCGLIVAGLYHPAAAIEPWTGLIVALGAAALMLLGVVAPAAQPELERAAGTGWADDDPALQSPVGQRWTAQRWAAAFVAGWVLMIAAGALAELAHQRLGLGSERAMLLALLAVALVATRAQLQIGATISFSLAIIWAMIGIAASAVSASITIATACVLGIAALAVVVVRVTT